MNGSARRVEFSAAQQDHAAQRLASKERNDVAVLTLDGGGIIRDCDTAGEYLFKYRRNELKGQQVSMLLPDLAGVPVVEHGQPNPRLRHLSRAGHQFCTVTKDGERFGSELYLNLLDNTGEARLTLLVCPGQESAD